MAEVADFVVIGDSAPAVGGKWQSRKFATGARNILKGDDGVELDNAYVTLVLTSPDGGEDAVIRVMVSVAGAAPAATNVSLS